MIHTVMSRRSLFRTGAAAAAALAAPTVVSTRGFAQSGTRTINMQLGWLPSSEQLGEVVARNLGYFEEEGLNLAIQPGGPSIDGVAIVASGRYELGQVTSSPSLMLAASQGIPVKCFAVGFQEHPHTFFSLPAKPIRTPQDMIGKKVGIQATGKVLLSALLRKNNIDESDVEVITIGSDYTPLLTGQVDTVAGWISNVAALKPLGEGLVTMRLWDTGVRLYACPYYATHDTIENRPEVLAGFLRAAGKGWGFARENPEKAVEMLVKELPNLNAEEQLASVKVALTFAFNEQTAKNGWGSFDRDVWQQQIDIYDELDQFSAGAPKIDDVITSSILDATADVRPKLG
ncbi:MAG: ABC transporter substrate-binding protein [Aquamicrobium sp.]|uniref:ABC transporter substrate-binding protein n=1 Tax=Aquamicrobium sp. TaxID=1872579 RepID=UPI00349EE3F6|nr:ABC transporter substrate-binding protein [Aquamicrobium sp.]